MPLNLVVHLVPSKDAFVALPPDVVDQIFAANEVRTLSLRCLLRSCSALAARLLREVLAALAPLAVLA